MDLNLDADEKYQGLIKKLNDYKSNVKNAEKSIADYLQNKKIKMLEVYESLQYQQYEVIGKIIVNYLKGDLKDYKFPDSGNFNDYLISLLSSACSANDKKIIANLLKNK